MYQKIHGEDEIKTSEVKKKIMNLLLDKKLKFEDIFESDFLSDKMVLSHLLMKLEESDDKKPAKMLDLIKGGIETGENTDEFKDTFYQFFGIYCDENTV